VFLTENKEQTDEKIRSEYFRKNQISGELKKIVSFVISIPASNVYTESIFSHTNNVWTKEQNTMVVDLVKAKLQFRLT
jgi:hypothetical protein